MEDQIEMFDGAFDSADGEYLRDAAIVKVERNHGEDMVRVLTAIYKAAREVGELTSDDVMRRMEGHMPLEEPRVIGAAMREAAREGWITPRNYWKASAYAPCHRRPKRVWLSLVKKA